MLETPLGFCLAIGECLNACKTAQNCTNLRFEPVIFYYYYYLFLGCQRNSVSGGLGAGSDGAGVYSGWVTGSCRAACLLLLTPVHLAGDFWLGFGAGTRVAKNLVPIKPPLRALLRLGHRSAPAALPPPPRHEEEPGRTRRFPRGFLMQSPAQNHVIPRGPSPPLLFCWRKAWRSRRKPARNQKPPRGLWTQPLNALWIPPCKFLLGQAAELLH